MPSEEIKLAKANLLQNLVDVMRFRSSQKLSELTDLKIEPYPDS